MRIIVFAVPALLLAGAAVAQSGGRADPLDPQAKVPPVEFRSPFEGYKPFADQETRDWRKANEEVGAAHGQESSKPQPAKPESPGGPAEKGQGAQGHQGHGGHQ